MVKATSSERIAGLAYLTPTAATALANMRKSMVNKRVLIRPWCAPTGRLLPMAATPDPSIVNPGTVGSIVVLCLFIAVGLVIYSGYKRINKLNRNRDDDK